MSHTSRSSVDVSTEKMDSPSLYCILYMLVICLHSFSQLLMSEITRKWFSRRLRGNGVKMWGFKPHNGTSEPATRPSIFRWCSFPTHSHVQYNYIYIYNYIYVYILTKAPPYFFVSFMCHFSIFLLLNARWLQRWTTRPVVWGWIPVSAEPMRPMHEITLSTVTPKFTIPHGRFMTWF